jgi:hypothetical protein
VPLHKSFAFNLDTSGIHYDPKMVIVKASTVDFDTAGTIAVAVTNGIIMLDHY